MTYYDDAKGKYQSVELHIDLHTMGSMSHGTIDITAYGETREEALKNMKLEIDNIKKQIDDDFARETVEIDGEGNRVGIIPGPRLSSGSTGNITIEGGPRVDQNS